MAKVRTEREEEAYIHLGQGLMGLGCPPARIFDMYEEIEKRIKELNSVHTAGKGFADKITIDRDRTSEGHEI